MSGHHSPFWAAGGVLSAAWGERDDPSDKVAGDALESWHTLNDAEQVCWWGADRPASAGVVLRLCRWRHTNDGDAESQTERKHL
jgi:hypothetical protein